MRPVFAHFETGSLLEPEDLHAVRMLLETADEVRASAPAPDGFPTLGALARGMFYLIRRRG